MISSVFGTLGQKVRDGDTWTRWLYAVGIVFGGLILAQSFGASWPMPVALLILAGVLIVNEGK